MKQKRISIFIFNICFLASLSLASAQETTSRKTIDSTLQVIDSKATEEEILSVVPDSISLKKLRYGLRLGVDLYKLTRHSYDKDFTGLEISGDYRISKNRYLASEIGTESITTQEPNFNYSAKGSFIKLGLDYNLYENWLDMENRISIGGRFCFSSFSQQINDYNSYTRNPYFGTTSPISLRENYNGLSSTWLEIVAAMQVQVIKNIFLGVSIRLNALISNKKPDNFDNLYIPGFNRTHEGTFGSGFSYTLSYFIPIYKKNVKTNVAKQN